MREQEPPESIQEPQTTQGAGAPDVLEPSTAEFRLAPGQRLALSFSAGGVVRLAITREESDATTEPALPVAAAEPTPRQAENPPTLRAEKQPRQTFRGIVSTHPRLETTPRGVPKTVFRLAMHPDEDTTTHLSCVAFDNQRQQLAQQVYQRVHKGEAVEVVGYKQERQLPGQDDKPRTVTEVYVAAVRHQQEPSPPSPHHESA